MCLTRYGEDDEWSQQAQATSKIPLRIRKRDVSSATKGASVSKTVESNGDSRITTKTVNALKTIKTTLGSEGTKSGGGTGLQGSYMTGFSSDQARTGEKNSISNVPSIDVDPFALKNGHSGSQTTRTFFSRSAASPHMSQTVKNGGVKIKINRGPNGEIVTTRTTRKYVVTKLPTKTVRRIIIRHGPTGAASNLMLGSSNNFATKTVKVSVSRGSTGGTGGIMAGGNTAVSTKTSRITTLHSPSRAVLNPIASIVRSGIKQERILGGHNVGVPSTATKTVSTVSVTKSVRPSGSVVQVTKQAVTPITAAPSASSNTATLRGIEVEVPGYTAGLRNNWKWVLARRVGVYPPYVQALDPDVLFYKLGIPKPNLPSLPTPVQNILNRVPVHPVGSDLYGYLLSSRILEKIRGFTEGVNGLTKLRSILSSTNTSNQDSANFLKSLFTGSESSPAGSTFLKKLLFASLSGSENNPLSSPYGGYLSSSYGGLFGRPYSGPYGTPWTSFLGGLQPEFATFLPKHSFYPGSLFDSYDSSGRSRSSTGVQYTFSEDGNIVPSAETPTPESNESAPGGSSYIQSLLATLTSGSVTNKRRYGHSYDEPLKTPSEKLARLLGEEKLRHLLKIPSERGSLRRRILNTLYRRDHINTPTLLRLLGVRPHTHLYNKIVREIEFRRKHEDVFSPSKFKIPYDAGSDRTQDLISSLPELSRKSNDDTLQYHSMLSGIEPRLLESFESSIRGSHGSSNKLITLLQRLQRRDVATEYSPLIEVLLAAKKRPQLAMSRGAPDSSSTQELTDDLLDYSRRDQSSDRTSQISKQLTKALLNSRRGPIKVHGTDGGQLSKLVSVHGTSHIEARPQGLRESREIYTKFHTSRAAAPAPISISPATAPGLEVTRQITQQSEPAALLGFNRFSTASSAQLPLQPYPQVVPQPFYSTGGSSVSDQAALLNRQFVASTDSVYGSPQGQPATTMMTGAGGYSSYATMPTSAGYISQYSPQTYYLGTTSLYGAHPHYVVEGHEAPGTRWQLRVWRQHPGVSYATPSYNGFQSSHLGSVVTRARETVTRGLHLGSQPGRFGFTTYGSTLSGGSMAGGASQYVVRAPDGSIVLSREPLPVGSPTQGAAASSVVVSQTTKQTTTTSGTPLPSLSDGLSGNSFQSTVETASSGGATKPAPLSELTQSKESSLLKSLASGSGSENSEASLSTEGASSSSLQADSDISQSKLRR